MASKVVILGTAHLSTTPGKCSPDGRLKEAEWSRELCSWLAPLFMDAGYKVFTDYPPLQPDAAMMGANWRQEQSRELRWRCDFVNAVARAYGKDNCLYVSVHNNASPPNDGGWHEANGFQVYVSRDASRTSREVAGSIYKEALAADLQGNRCLPPLFYWTADFYVLKHTDCPAVLCECLFQDNWRDCKYLLSLMGKGAISRAIFQGVNKVFGADINSKK